MKRFATWAQPTTHRFIAIGSHRLSVRDRRPIAGDDVPPRRGRRPCRAGSPTRGARIVGGAATISPSATRTAGATNGEGQAVGRGDHETARPLQLRARRSQTVSSAMAVDLDAAPDLDHLDALLEELGCDVEHIHDLLAELICDHPARRPATGTSLPPASGSMDSASAISCARRSSSAGDVRRTNAELSSSSSMLTRVSTRCDARVLRHGCRPERCVIARGRLASGVPTQV